MWENKLSYIEKQSYWLEKKYIFYIEICVHVQEEKLSIKLSTQPRWWPRFGLRCNCMTESGDSYLC